LKLTLVTETFPPEINGVAMTLGQLVAGLQAREICVTVVTPAPRKRLDKYPDSLHIIPVPGFPIPKYPDLRFGMPAHARLKQEWQAERPDIIHVATEGPLGWSASRVARGLGIPVVSSFHTNFHSYGHHYGYGFLRKGVLRWLLNFHNKTERTFAPSLDLMETLEEQGFQNLRLFARGVDTALFGPHQRDAQLRASWGAGQETPVALYVGRLAREKNLPLVEQAYARMKESLPDLRFVLVGDGPDRKRIQTAYPEAIFTGVKTGRELAACYASADCFLFGSVTETFGNVVTEAMASALAVLAYDYAAPGRFIDSPNNGLLAPLGNEPAFLEQARQLALIRDDWGTIGQAARETILPHSWDSIIESYLEEIHPLSNSTAA
jgi:glycosyltransferase involved in cell wall biosynthesis